MQAKSKSNSFTVIKQSTETWKSDNSEVEVVC